MSSANKRGFVLTCLLIFSFVSSLISSPLITEVMSNVKGSDTGPGSPGDRNEFVEIYNNSDSSIIITHFFIGDGDAVDKIIVWEDSLGIPSENVVVHDSVLKPHGFAIILDPEYCSSEYANQPYFKPYNFGDSSLVVTVGNTTIGNGLSTSDPIFLYDSNLVIIDTYGTPFDTTDKIPCDPGDGISMEKIYLLGSDEEKNWQPSESSQGCTPGDFNSVSENNLIDIDFSFNNTDDSTTLNFNIINKFNILLQDASIFLKLYKFTGNSDIIYVDSSLLFAGDISDSVISVHCTKNMDSSEIYILKLGIKSLKISSFHNFWMKNTPDAIPPLEINEIMEHNGVSPDWVEIRNISEDTLYIHNASISYGNSIAALPNFTINPGEYKVIVHDTTSFFNKYSRNTDLIFAKNNFSIAYGDTLKFFIGNCDLENIHIDRNIHFGKDTSIERIKGEIPASEENNWTFSRSYNGATPGGKNSVSESSTANSVNQISISPNPFDYNRDNAILIKIPQTISLVKSLRLYKTDGYKIFDMNMANPYLKEFIWKPTSHRGKTLTTGLYIIVLLYDDRFGERHIAKIPLAVKN